MANRLAWRQSAVMAGGAQGRCTFEHAADVAVCAIEWCVSPGQGEAEFQMVERAFDNLGGHLGDYIGGFFGFEACFRNNRDCQLVREFPFFLRYPGYPGPGIGFEQ